MADVSKLARTRLAKAPVAGPHPDADLLTAFAEQSATPAEREQVLAHLATCAECREVVALAAPAEPVEEAVAVAPSKPKWLPWPVLRWGAVAAAVAVVAIAVIVQAPRYQERAPMSASTPAAAAKVKPDQAAGFASADTKTHGAVTANEPQPQAKESGPKKNESEFAYAPGKKVASPTAEMDTLAAVPPPPSPATAPTQRAEAKLQKQAPPASGTVGAMATSEHAKTATAAQTEMAAASTPAAQPPTASNENMTMARSAPAASKPAPAREERGNYAADAYYGGSAGGALKERRDTGQAQLRGIAYKWTVTSDGRVQRSTDGRTWFFVPVDPKARLRALASDGDEVWVGGDRAALYHSSDAGESWNKVPMDRVAGDIIRIVINGDTLQISTSAGQTISMSHNAPSESPAKPNSPR